MGFDPDAYLSGSGGTATASPPPADFNPDAYLASDNSFNPDDYLNPKKKPDTGAIIADAINRFGRATASTFVKAGEGALRLVDAPGLGVVARPVVDGMANTLERVATEIKNRQPGETYPLAALDQSVPAKVSEAAGGSLATLGLAEVSLPTMLLGGAAQTYAEHYDTTKAGGGSDEEAKHAGVIGAIKQAPELAGYMVAGKLGALGAAKLLGPAASPLLRGLVGGAAALPANMAASAAIGKIEGRPYDVSNLTNDALFAIFHGVNESTHARAAAAGEELAHRGIDPANGTAFGIGDIKIEGGDNTNANKTEISSAQADVQSQGAAIQAESGASPSESVSGYVGSETGPLQGEQTPSAADAQVNLDQGAAGGPGGAQSAGTDPLEPVPAGPESGPIAPGETPGAADHSGSVTQSDTQGESAPADAGAVQPTPVVLKSLADLPALPEPTGPITVYRGEPSGKTSTAGDGAHKFYTETPEEAAGYAGKGGRVIQETLDFQNPLRADNWVAAKKRLELPNDTSMASLLDTAATRGHDGIIWRHHGKTEFVKLEPTAPDQKGTNEIKNTQGGSPNAVTAKDAGAAGPEIQQTIPRGESGASPPPEQLRASDAPGKRLTEAAAERAAQEKAHAQAAQNAAQTKLFPEGLRLRARANEAGYFSGDHLQAAADFGQRIYKAGMDFVQWSAHLLRQLGEKIRPHLESIWNSFTGDNLLPHARERGAVGYTGGPRKRGGEPPSQADYENAANNGAKMRGHVATVQRMTEVSPDTKARVESWYSPIRLTEVNERARATIDQAGLGPAKDAFINSTTITADVLALGHHVALRLDGLGRYEEASDVRNAMAEKATNPAQSLWYISTISKTSPEGLIREAQKIVTEQIGDDAEKQKLLAKIQELQVKLNKVPEGPERQAQIGSAIEQLKQVNQPSQRLSAAQINELVQRHRAGALTAQDLGDRIAKYLKVPKLTAESIDRIKAAQRAYAEAEQRGDPIMALQRGAEMMDAVYDQVPRSFWEKVRATAVISMILHGRLPVRIGISNAIKLAGQTAVDGIENIPRDIGRIFTGQKTITGDQFKAIAEGLKEPGTAFQAGFADARARNLSLWPSFKEGMRTMLDMASMTTRGIFDLTDIKGRSSHTFSSRFGRLAEDTVTLIHNIVPYAFWNAGYKSSLVRQMRIARVDVPTEEMVGNARIDANKAIFQNETAVYKMMVELRKTLDLPTAQITKGKYGFGTATIPFAKVPGAILTEGATWTPLGFIRAGWEAFRPLTGSEFRPKEMGDALIKAALGTGSTVLSGYWLAKIGVLTGAPDENKDIEAMRKALGWGAYRLNLSELKRRVLSGNFTTKSPTPAPGDMIINYNWLEPTAFGVAVGADMAHSQEKRLIDLRRGKLTSGAAFTALTAGVKSFTDSPMLQGIQNLATNYSEKGLTGAGVGVVSNIPGNFVPSLVRQWTQYIDNTTRETRGGSPVDVEVNRIMAQIPGLSTKYPARYDVFGDAVHRYNYGNNSVLNVFFNPAQISRFKSNPEVAEMIHLYEMSGSASGLPGNVSKNITVNGKQMELDNVQLATYQRYVGKESAAVVTRLLASPQFAAEPERIRQSIIANVVGATHTAAKIDLFGEKPVQIAPGGLSGPTIRGPSAMDLAALLGARGQGLTRKVDPVNP